MVPHPIQPLVLSLRPYPYVWAVNPHTRCLPLPGMLGARWGIKWTLLSGLVLQLAGIGTLYGWRDGWSTPENRWKGILFVTCAQVGGC